MSRLDQNGGDAKKKVVSLGPSSEEIRSRPEQEVAMPEGKIKTAASYGDRARARAQATNSIKKGGKPLGGAPPLEREKMEQIATSMAPRPDFGGEAPAPTRQPKEPPKDMVQGVGAGYHVNQEMARGNVDRPVSMREAKKMAEDAKQGRDEKKPLSQETIAGLEKMNQLGESGEVPEAPADETDIRESLEDAEQGVEPSEDEQFSLDFAGIAEARLVLVSPERRKSIEDRLEKMNISDLITKREISQTIPVVPGEIEYTFRTFNQHEHLFCLQYIFDTQGSAAYTEELLNTAKLACSLVSINGAHLPDHRKNVGSSKESVDKELFEKKLFHVGSFPTQMIADMSVQAIWFTDRVNKLFSLEHLKNG
jgi:hypothetical protein